MVALGERARAIQVDAHAIRRKRKEFVLALELRFGLPPRPQRFNISTPSPLLYIPDLLGIQVFFDQVHTHSVPPIAAAIDSFRLAETPSNFMLPEPTLPDQSRQDSQADVLSVLGE